MTTPITPADLAMLERVAAEADEPHLSVRFYAIARNWLPRLVRALAASETITWIPVAERLPEPDVTVLHWDGEISVAGRDAKGQWWLEGREEYGPLATAPTHWAELPKGPKP